MIPTEVFVGLLLSPALLGILISLLPSKRDLSPVSFALCIVSCAFGSVTYPVVHSGEIMSFPVSSMLGAYQVRFDGLSSLMISLSSVVFMMITVHALGSHKRGNRFAGLVCALFAACVLAICADSVILLLISWECVTLVTFLLASNSSGAEKWRYFVITHFGGLIIMTVFAAMWYVSGTPILSEMDPVSSLIGSGTASVMIALLFAGFGTKLGLIPFHVWMPDLYSIAPIHTVALLSTVCSNVAVVLLFKSVFLWIGIPAGTFMPLVIILLVAGTAVWGAMESLIMTEPRRILAYSSMENMALVLLCLAMGMMMVSLDLGTGLFTMIVVAAFLHTINHSFFKSLMLLNIGTVEDSTGEYMIERMGGLAKYLPAVSVFAFIGVMSMAAVPPMNGFVSEWLMIKTVITAGVGTSTVNIVLPLVVAVLGICGMLAAVSYARMYGFIFLGRPRSKAMKSPRKAGRLVLAPLLVLSAACIALGVLAVPAVDALAACSSAGLPGPSAGLIADSLNPPMIAVLLASVCLIVYGLFRLTKKKKTEVKTWDCGTELHPDMQYSSVGFTQPLVRVFHPIYGDKTEIVDDEAGGRYRVTFVEPFTKYILTPVGRAVKFVSDKVERMQTGNIQDYLAHILVVLIVILLGARFLWT